MQRREAALYGLFFILVVLGGYVAMASAEPVPVGDSPAHTLHVGDKFTVNGQKYVLSGINTSTDQNGNVLRAASIKQAGSKKTISFGESAAARMLIVEGGVPTWVTYTPSTGTISLGGAEYGAYYPNNNTVKLMNRDVYSQEVSSMKTLSDRFRGVWAVTVLGLLSAILVVGISYLPNRG